MGKPSPPPSPNYAGVAQAQGAANIDAARAAGVMNNPNIVTPYGSQTVTWGTPGGQSAPPSTGGPSHQPVSADGTIPLTFQFPRLDANGQFGRLTLNVSPSDLSGQANSELQAALRPNDKGQPIDPTTGALLQPGSFVNGGQLWTNPNTGQSQSLYNWVFGNSPTTGGTGSGSGGTAMVDSNGKPIEQPTITQTLNPISQQTLDQSQLAQLGLASLANKQTQNVSGLLNNGFTFNPSQAGLQTSLPGNFTAAADTNPVDLFKIGAAQGINTSGVPSMPVSPGMTAQQAIMSRLQPQIQLQRQQVQNQLTQQGLVPGDEAYNNAMKILGQQENDQLTQATLGGLGLDLSANQQGFGQAATLSQAQNAALGQNQQTALAQQQSDQQMAAQHNAAAAQNFTTALQSGQFGNQAQQQALAQQLQLYNQPINAITALLSGSQVQTPQFQPYTGQGVQAAPLFEGAQAQGAYNQQTYAQQVAQRNAMMGGLFGLASGATGGLFGLGGSGGGGGLMSGSVSPYWLGY